MNIHGIKLSFKNSNFKCSESKNDFIKNQAYFKKKNYVIILHLKSFLAFLQKMLRN